MTYKMISLNVFEENLRQAMNERIAQFAEQLRKTPVGSEVKSRRQWTEEFKQWSLQQKELEDLFLSYLKETTDGEIQ